MKEGNKFVVAQIIPSLHSGGVERGAIDIAKTLKKNNMTPLVVSSGGRLVSQLRKYGIQHIDLPVHSKNPITIFLNIGRIKKLIKNYNINILHVRSRSPMISAYFACKKCNIPLVSTFHGTYSFKLISSNSKIKSFYNSFMVKANHVIAVSNFIKKYILDNFDKESNKELENKISVIQRGVDLDYFNINKISKYHITEIVNKWNLPENKNIITLPGRITSWKGHEFLLNALKKVKSDYYCIFVGSDHGHEQFYKKLEKQIIESGLEGKVRFVGVCENMPAVYAISSLIVCPSIKPEAFGRIAIEAQANSRLVIATNIGGYLETIIDKKTGFLVNPYDADEFAKLIDHCLNLNNEEYEKIISEARKNVEENFSNEKMFNATLDVYKKLLTNPNN